MNKRLLIDYVRIDRDRLEEMGYERGYMSTGCRWPWLGEYLGEIVKDDVLVLRSVSDGEEDEMIDD